MRSLQRKVMMIYLQAFLSDLPFKLYIISSSETKVKTNPSFLFHYQDTFFIQKLCLECCGVGINISVLQQLMK